MEIFYIFVINKYFDTIKIFMTSGRRRTQGRVYNCLKCVVIVLQGQNLLLTYRCAILKGFFSKRSEAKEWTCSLGTWICKCRCKDSAENP